MRRIVIIGAGFGGLWTARELHRVEDVEVTIVDRRNHHLFQPLLYQVATAGLSPADIAVPIRSLFPGGSNVSVRHETVTSIDRRERVVETGTGSRIPFDQLVVAAGGRHAYFGHEDWAPLAPGLKSIEDATEIRRRILTAFEQAELEPEADRRARLMTFVVVGGGPTGVEMAGALAEMSRFTLASDFERIDPTQARVVLIEALPGLLPSFDEEQAERARRDLEALGVEVRLGQPVTALDADRVRLESDEIPARTVVWAAGVQASPLGRSLDVECDRAGRVRIAPDLALPDDPDVFVIGDLAHVEDASGQMLPGVAPVAMAEGRYVAGLIARGQERPDRPPFEYRDKGQLATIGRKRAVAELPGGLRIGGTLAWLLWLFVHIYYLIGFRNRFFVFCSWAWSYLTYRRGARLILPSAWRADEEEDAPSR